MRKLQYIAIVCFVATLFACGEKTREAEIADSVLSAINQVDEIYSISPFEVQDTFVVNGKTYTYEFEFLNSDSLPIVTNSLEEKYYDNYVNLAIATNGNVILEKTFTKASFKQYIKDTDYSNFALIGFNYHLSRLNDHSRLNFIATVGEPDEASDHTIPIAIMISESGAISTEVADDIDSEPMIEDATGGLNVDPADNSGV